MAEGLRAFAVPIEDASDYFSNNFHLLEPFAVGEGALQLSVHCYLAPLIFPFSDLRQKFFPRIQTLSPKHFVW